MSQRPDDQKPSDPPPEVNDLDPNDPIADQYRRRAVNGAVRAIITRGPGDQSLSTAEMLAQLRDCDEIVRAIVLKITDGEAARRAVTTLRAVTDVISLARSAERAARELNLAELAHLASQIARTDATSLVVTGHPLGERVVAARHYLAGAWGETESQ